jgi:hypothetical protein
MEEHIRDEVERTLASLDHMERLSAGPAFSARLMARLDSGEGQVASRRLPLIPRVFVPVLRPALLAILVLGNLLTIVSVAKSDHSTTWLDKGSVTTVAADYSLTEDPEGPFLSRKEIGK